MLFSMTGFGEARGGNVSIEVRSVNNRHLKVNVRGTDPYPMLESDFEKVIRRSVKRGTLLVQVRVERSLPAGLTRLNTGLLKSYIAQITDDLKALSPADRSALIAGALALPGVAPDGFAASGVCEEEWPQVEQTLTAALVKLNVAREVEGRAMVAELRQLTAGIAERMSHIAEHLPAIAANYRKRLMERLTTAIADAKVSIEADHVLREVAIFADRIDVSEEMTRLTSHLAAFDEILDGGSDSPGRRLEFVVQEMGREANTLGSKAGDAAVSRYVVDIKATLEKIRELVQNVE